MAKVLKIEDSFIPCGYMECGQYGDQYLKVYTNWTAYAHSGNSCIRFDLLPCPKNMGGVYWMDINCNWGTTKGKDFSKYRFSKLTFYAKGHDGGERIKFITGGVDSEKKSKDSFKTEKIVTLSRYWEKYELDLSGQSLRSVIGPFAWFATISDNPEGVSFYLDDIQFEQ